MVDSIFLFSVDVWTAIETRNRWLFLLLIICSFARGGGGVNSTFVLSSSQRLWVLGGLEQCVRFLVIMRAGERGDGREHGLSKCSGWHEVGGRRWSWFVKSCVVDARIFARSEQGRDMSASETRV